MSAEARLVELGERGEAFQIEIVELAASVPSKKVRCGERRGGRERGGNALFVLHN